jgi:DedD protein
VKEAYKHRLIGAAILGAAAVLFLPSFFKDQQQYRVDTDSQIPQRPQITAVDFSEPVQPQDIQPAPAPETMFVPEEAPPVAPVPISSSRAEVKPSTENTDSLADMPLNADGLPNAWVIQVASLSSKEAATKLRDQLQSQGYKAYVRSIKVGTGEAHRIFIGPKLDKAEAQQLKKELDKKLKVNSLVLPFKP